MSNRVDVTVAVSTVQAQLDINTVKAQADEVVRQWKIDRAIMIQQIREGLTLISQLWSTFRQAMSLFGQQIDPFFGALVGMVLATTSMLISASATLSATVLGIPLGAVIFGLAMSFNILTIAKLVADKEKTDGMMTSMIQAISRGAQGGGVPGTVGLGGF